MNHDWSILKCLWTFSCTKWPRISLSVCAWRLEVAKDLDFFYRSWLMTYVRTDPQSIWWASHILAQLWYFCKKISLYMAWFFETLHALTPKLLPRIHGWQHKTQKVMMMMQREAAWSFPQRKRSKKESTKGDDDGHLRRLFCCARSCG